MTNIQIIKRDSIPAITSIEEGGAVHQLGELRDFSWSEPLKRFMGDGCGFSASWVRLTDGEVLDPHTHPVLSMMVFYSGGGELIGDLQRPLFGDEVVVVPPGCLHGFIAGTSGLWGLSIQFARGLYSSPEKPRVIFAASESSLAEIVAHCNVRAAALSRRPLFDLLSSDTLKGAARIALMGALQVWLKGVEGLLVARHATCNDPAYQRLFHEGMLDFVEHSRVQESSHGRQQLVRDSALHALTNWFAHQMYVLDNAEKAAIVHLVVERLNDLLRRHVAPSLGRRQVEDAFGPERSDSNPRSARALELLAHETPDGFSKLRMRIEEAWDMAEAVTDRIGLLTRAAMS